MIKLTGQQVKLATDKAAKRTDHYSKWWDTVAEELNALLAETEAPAQPEPQEGRFRSLQQAFEEGYSEGMKRREEQVERLSIQLKGMHEHYNYLCKTIADAKICDPMQPVIIEREAAPVPPVEPSCPDCGHSFKDNMHGFDQNDAHIEDDRLVHSGRCTYCKVCNPDPPAPTPTSREIVCPNDPTHRLSWRGMHCEVCGIFVGSPPDVNQLEIYLQTEREMHNAWRKRAEEAEAALDARPKITGERVKAAMQKCFRWYEDDACMRYSYDAIAKELEGR